MTLLAEEFGYKAPDALEINDAVEADDSTYSSEKIVELIPTTAHDTVSLGIYDAEPARGSVSNIHGGLVAIVTADTLALGQSVPLTKGMAKMMIVLNAGTDFVGDMLITGDTIDRDTGDKTVGDTETISVTSLTTDNSTTDSNGNTKHSFVDAYLSTKWFTGSVTITTINLDISDIDVYGISFEQFDDTENLVLDTFDINLLTTNVAAEFDAYLYSLIITGVNKCSVILSAQVHVGADGETALVDRYWRLRRGKINQALNGLTDGVWAELHYSNSPAYVEDMSMKIWATETTTLG